MVTTTTISIIDDNVTYETPEDYNYDSANAGLINLATVAGANDELDLYYGSNDKIIVTGANDYVYNEGDHALINAQSASAGGDFETYGPGSTIFGSGANDYIYSYGGYETVTVTGGSSSDAGVHTVTGTTVIEIGDSVYGLAGNDTIYFATADTVYGGQGNDDLVLEYNFNSNDVGLPNSELGAYVSGDAGDNIVDLRLSLSGYDTAFGGTGDDTIYASSGGNEQLYGQTGNDTISITGGYGDVVYGGMGNDLIVVTGASGGHFISADLGNDTVDLSGSSYGDNTVYGGAGDDTVYGSTGSDDQIYGQTGNDTIYLEGNDDVVYGGQGNDLIYDQGHSYSFISGDLGDDSIFASGAFDTIYGGDGNDSILASGASDQLYGQAGNDIITFTAANAPATVFGGAGNDVITVTYAVTHTAVTDTTVSTTDANGGATNASGHYTTTTVTEGGGAHFLSGDLGDDSIYGGSGGDTFIGGAGSDVLISHRMEASGNDPLADGYQAGGPADHFDFFQNDSIGASPTAPGTGSDISTGGGEAGIDHITGFQLNVTEVAYNPGTTVGSTHVNYVNAQAGDDLYFLTGTHTTEGTATLDTNVFYGTVENTVAAGTVTEQSDYAVAYTYAFGTGGTAAAETADNHFAGAVDFIVVDVVDNGTGATNNGNVFVFDHNGNAVALDGAGLQSTGTTAGFQDSSSPTGGALNAPNEPVVSVNIYH